MSSLIPPSLQTLAVGQMYSKATLVSGQPKQIKCVDIAGQTYSISSGAFTSISLEDDWFEDQRDPEAVIALLRSTTEFKPDIFTFLQRLPNVTPKYSFHCEYESVAALKVSTFDHWWHKQLKGTTRNMIRKSQKAGVEVRDAEFDDAFVTGVTAIFNETPVRQGRRFWHYGKDVATVRQQFSRYLHREHLIGAHYQNQLVGFAMLGNAGNYFDLGQIISLVQHRDKAITNALLSKAVEVCAANQIPYLVYGFWNEGTLVNFKRHSGFERVDLPRYFVALSGKGRLALRVGAHRGWKEMIPARIKTPLKRMRQMWHGIKPE